MTKLNTIKTCASVTMALCLLTATAAANELPHWDYEGESGPEEWANLHEDYSACGLGDQQSPIDVVTTEVIEAELPEIAINWGDAVPLKVVNNGHSIQGIAPEMGEATINGRDDTLKQFHFHAPSEHMIDGERFPAEVHFVHEAPDGTLAVIGILLEGGGSNQLVEDMIAVAPETVGEAEIEAHNLHDLQPDDLSVYRYLGSLTTPPCSENVDWNLLQTPVQISDAALERLTELSHNDARPVQDLARRFVLK